MEIIEFRELAAKKGIPLEDIEEMITEYTTALKEDGIAIPLESRIWLLDVIHEPQDPPYPAIPD
ncbi:MAG: hypothetical protein LBQ30_02940 [Treponema sp.]|jgi:hypothetical protein|nr:hypothetical protein [Treponema sp.]